MIPNCPDCKTNFDAQFTGTDADGQMAYACDASHTGHGPTFFSAPLADPVTATVAKTAVKSVKYDLPVTDDLLDPLLKCVFADDGWTEFGVIEHRLHQLAPEVFAGHVFAQGHRMFGPKETTASGARVSTALTRLAKQGFLVEDYLKSSGDAWKHSSLISFWALTPLAEHAGTLTWAAYCKQEGRPNGWTDADRAGLTSPSQGIQGDAL